MNLFYIFLIFEIFAYKMIYKFIFSTICYSKPIENEKAKEELKKWKFHIKDILYYLVTIIAILKPLMGNEISKSLFLIGIIPIFVSLFLYIYSFIKNTNINAWAIDFFFLEGIAIQTNSWLCSALGFVYLVYNIACKKSKTDNR